MAELSDTKILILDAAEQAFADLGYSGTSLRRIITSAGVNLAAVHYHFGSKEALLKAVLVRRLEPLNRERLELLDQIEAAAGDGPLPLEAVIEALVGPPLRLINDPSRGGEVFMRLLGRLLPEPDEPLQTLITSQFNEIVERFFAAFRRALPELPVNELFWRAHFGVGAMAHTLCSCKMLKTMSGGLCDPTDTRTAIRELVLFMSAGMRAQSTSAKRKASKR
jgi:AcrR family transcriptional regulator